MSRIQQTFAALGNKKALIPYITVGDPDIGATLAIMHSMVENGADILEFGCAFFRPDGGWSDYSACGGTCVGNGVSLRDVLDVVRRFRETDTQTPVVLMGYLNPIHKMGYREFAQEAAKAGVDGVLTVDSPIETIDSLYRELKGNGVDCIFLIAPTTTEGRI